jgi:tRNA(Ile)-lysidine synthase
MDVLKQVGCLIERHELLANGDGVLVGLSGGPDSVALLHLLTRLRRSYSLKLHAVYINHGLRPKAARQEETFCEQLCRKWHVGFQVVRADIPALAKKRRVGFEEAARDFRYSVFDELATKLNCARIALGHQADDQVETVLFRVIRGTGRTGMAGIPVKRGKIIRPLLETPRIDILSHLNRRRLAYCHDSSNADISFQRNYLRHKLLPEIRRRLNPQVDRAIRDLSEVLGEEEGFLAEMSRRVYKRMASTSAGSKLMLDLQIYLGYPHWLRRRILRIALADLTGKRLSPDKKTIERIDIAAQAKLGSLSVGGGIQVEIARQQLVLCGPARSAQPIKLEMLKRWVRSAGLGLEFRARSARRRGLAIPKVRRADRVKIDRARLFLPLLVRPIRSGDRFVPLGMSGRKKVGDYLTDRKFPVSRRDEVAAVCDDKGIVWLVGWEIADRVKIDSTTTEVVTLEYRNVKARQSKTV